MRKPSLILYIISAVLSLALIIGGIVYCANSFPLTEAELTAAYSQYMQGFNDIDQSIVVPPDYPAFVFGVKTLPSMAGLYLIIGGTLCLITDIIGIAFILKNKTSKPFHIAAIIIGAISFHPLLVTASIFRFVEADKEEVIPA